MHNSLPKDKKTYWHILREFQHCHVLMIPIPTVFPTNVMMNDDMPVVQLNIQEPAAYKVR